MARTPEPQAGESQAGAGRLDLVVTRVVDAPRALVWQAWTDPEHLKRWWAPAPFTTPECELDARPGGVFRTLMRAPDGTEYPGLGVFLEVVEHERIVFTDTLEPGWRPARNSFFTAVVTLEELGGGKTRYTARAAQGRGRPREARGDGVPRGLGDVPRPARGVGGADEGSRVTGRRRGGCRCGRVAFEVEGRPSGAVACGCSLCAYKGAPLWAVPRDALRLLAPEEGAVGTYAFGRGAIEPRFCPRCGIHPFAEDADPGDERMAYVNLRCVEGLDLDSVPVLEFDGRSM